MIQGTVYDRFKSKNGFRICSGCIRYFPDSFLTAIVTDRKSSDRFLTHPIGIQLVDDRLKMKQIGLR